MRGTKDATQNQEAAGGPGGGQRLASCCVSSPGQVLVVCHPSRSSQQLRRLPSHYHWFCFLQCLSLEVNHAMKMENSRNKGFTIFRSQPILSRVMKSHTLPFQKEAAILILPCRPQKVTDHLTLGQDHLRHPLLLLIPSLCGPKDGEHPLTRHCGSRPRAHSFIAVYCCHHPVSLLSMALI